MNTTIKYSLVIPVFNSSQSLSRLFDELKNSFSFLINEMEWIFVDDGSKDNSWDILKKLKIEYSIFNIKLFRLSKNFGQVSATLCGLHQAKGELIMTMDDDLQYAPQDMLLLLDRYNKGDISIVFGVTKKKQNFLKNWGSLWAKTFFIRFFLREMDYKLENSSFRLFDRKWIPKDNNNNWLFEEQNLFLTWVTSSKHIYYVEVKHSERLEGHSGNTIFSKIKVFFQTLVKFVVNPLALFVYFGLVMMTFSGFILILYRRFGVESFPMGYQVSNLIFLFLNGLTFIALGAIGNFLALIYQKLLNKPKYFIVESIEN